MIRLFHTLLTHLKDLKTQRKAERREKMMIAKLAQLVAQTRDSYEIVDYRKRRAAALKGRALKRERAHG